MSYSPEAYAKAFVVALGADKEKRADFFIANLLKALGRRGDSRKLGKVAEHIENLLVQKEGGRVVIVESARPLSDSAKKELARRFQKKDIVRDKIRPELIAGVRIMVNGERAFDMSLKGRLGKLFN